MGVVAACNEVARSKIVGLEAAMIDAVESGMFAPCLNEPSHYFAPGLYARELLIPAGTAIVGKIHKHAHINLISRGRIRVFTEFGSDVFDADASPITFVSEPGTKRAVYAETDTVWTTFHPTDETDLEKIEAHVIAKDYNELKMLSYSDIKGLIS